MPAVAVKDVFSGNDVPAQAELLLNLLNDAAGGKDVSSSVSEVAEYYIAAGVGNVNVKKLAYDVCKAVQLSDLDYDYIASGIKIDISSESPDSQTVALAAITNLPPQQLITFVEAGDAGNMIEPLVRSPEEEVRAAAVHALGCITLVPEVQAFITSSPGFVAQALDWMDWVTDATIDPATSAVASAVSVLNRLFERAEASSSQHNAESYFSAQMVERVAKRLGAGMGPMLQAWQQLPANIQVAAAQLLRRLATYIISHGSQLVDAKQPAASGSISACVPPLISFLLTLCASINPATKLEAARSVLAISKAANSTQGLDLVARLSVVPQAAVGAAMEALLDLKGRQMVEPALEGIATSVAAHLSELPLAARAPMMARLWPLIAQLPSATQRMAAFALAWQAAIQLDLETRGMQLRGEDTSSGATLASLLDDPFLRETITARPVMPTRAAPSAPPAAAATPASPTAAAGSTSNPGSIPSTPTAAAAAPAAAPPAAAPPLAAQGPSLKQSMTGRLSSFRSAKNLLTRSPRTTADSMNSTTSTSAPATEATKLTSTNPPSLRHELVCTLTQVLASHVHASLAQLLGPPPADVPDSQKTGWAERLAQVVAWLGAAVAVLNGTRACLQWEPLVNPMTSQAGSAQPMPASAAVNLTTVPADCWLNLLQRSSLALKAVLAGQGHASLASMMRAASNVAGFTMSDATTGAVANVFLECGSSLQMVLRRAISEWRLVSRALRPRLLWVAAQHLELPAVHDDTWHHLLGCLEDQLLRIWRMEQEAKAREYLASSQSGCLPRTLLLGGPGRDKKEAATFDLATASAMVEWPEYRADGMQASMAVLQHMVWLLQENKPAPKPEEKEKDPKAGDGKEEDGASKADADAPAKAAAARAAQGRAALVAKLQTLLQQVARVDSCGSDIQEWCARLQLALDPLYVDPSGFGAMAVGGGGGAPQGRAFSTSVMGVSGYNPYGPRPSQVAQQPRRPTHSRHHTLDSVDSDALETTAAPQPADAAAAAGDAAGTVPDYSRAPDVLLPKSATTAGAWGYPFGGPRSSVLFMSRRSRRHRMMSAQLQTAMTQLRLRDQGPSSQQPAASGAGIGPVLGSGSTFRLDKQSFWRNLGDGGGGWQEISGPSDPVLVSALYVMSPDEPNTVQLQLKVLNRLEVDVSQIEVQLRLVGALLADRRAASWQLPRLIPMEGARQQFKLKVLGYSRMEVHTRLQLPTGPTGRTDAVLPMLHCRPLRISMAAPLQRPLAETSPATFFSTWASLPMKMQVSGVCSQPGVDGLLLLMSALAHQPMQQVWLQNLPAIGGCSAGYLSQVGSQAGDVLAIMLVAQLMPAPSAPQGDTLTTAATLAANNAYGSYNAPAPAAAPAAARGPPTRRPAASSVLTEIGGTGAALSSTAAWKASVAASSTPAAAAAADGNAAAAAAASPAVLTSASTRAVVQLYVRTTSHEAFHTIQAHTADWLEDITLGVLALGLDIPEYGNPDMPPLHPAVATLRAPYTQQLLPDLPEKPQKPSSETAAEAPAAEAAAEANGGTVLVPSSPRRLRELRDEDDSDIAEEDLYVEDEVEEVVVSEQDADGFGAELVAEEEPEEEPPTGWVGQVAVAEWRRLMVAAGRA